MTTYQKSTACLFSLRTPGGATLHFVTYSHQYFVDNYHITHWLDG